MAKKLKKYDVTFYYHTMATVTVEAENEDEALELAESEVTSDECTKQILSNLTEDGDTDVDEVGE